MSRVKSFSIPPSDTPAKQLIEHVEKYCSTTGVTFSHVVIAAIKLYLENGGCPLTTKMKQD